MRLLQIEIFTWLVVLVSTFPQPETMENQEQIELIILQSAAESHVTTNYKEINTASKVQTKSLSHQTTNKSLDINANNEDQKNLMEVDHLSAIKVMTRVGENSAHKSTTELLTQSEKEKLSQMISFPQKITQISIENLISNITSRTAGSEKILRALDNDYLVFAVADVDMGNDFTALRLKKLHIIPRDSIINNSKHLGRNSDDDSGAVEDEEGRMIKMHKLKKYVRRLMRMIRKGTRKVTKATFFRSETPEKITPVKSYFNGIFFKVTDNILRPLNLQ